MRASLKRRHGGVRWRARRAAENMRGWFLISSSRNDLRSLRANISGNSQTTGRKPSVIILESPIRFTASSERQRTSSRKGAYAQEQQVMERRGFVNMLPSAICNGMHPRRAIIYAGSSARAEREYTRPRGNRRHAFPMSLRYFDRQLPISMLLARLSSSSSETRKMTARARKRAIQQGVSQALAPLPKTEGTPRRYAHESVRDFDPRYVHRNILRKAYLENEEHARKRMITNAMQQHALVRIADRVIDQCMDCPEQTRDRPIPNWARNWRRISPAAF